VQLMDDSDKEVLLSEARHSGLRWVHIPTIACSASRHAPGDLHIQQQHEYASQ
jgi:hypothetical protein